MSEGAKLMPGSEHDRGPCTFACGEVVRTYVPQRRPGFKKHFCCQACFLCQGGKRENIVSLEN